MVNKYGRIGGGVLVGMILISTIVEVIELLIVLSLSGDSFEVLKSDRDRYFEVRNQPWVLLAKMLYTFIASFVAGWITSWIAKSERRQAVVALTIIQVGVLIWAGFFSAISETGPREMWVGLCFAVAIGINTGYKTYLRKKDK